MARHKPNLPPNPEPALTLAQRLEHAKAKLAAAETLLETTYWQGAVDMIEAFSAGWPMPETIGAGAKANADSEPK